MIRKGNFEAVEFKDVKEIIYNSAKVYGDNIAFVIKKENKERVEINYKEFLDDINSVGTAFYSIGLKNKRVAIIGKNRYEWVLAHLANLLGGIVSVPLDKDLQMEELENSLIRSKADALVFDKKMLPFIEEIKKNNKTVIKEFIAMDDLEGYISIGKLLEKGKKLIAGGNKEFIDNKIDENALSILLFTSGTTSNSKAVMLSQRNIAANIYSMQLVEDIRSTDTNIAFLPFHHVFGSTGLIMMLVSGVRNAFPDGLRYIKQNMQEYEASIFIGVPLLQEAIYKAVLKEIDKQGKTKLVKIAIAISNFLLFFHIDIRRKLFKDIINNLGGKLRLIILGGAAADPKVIKGFKNFGIDSVQGYGLSETSPVIASESYFYVKPGTVGYPMKNVDIEIYNPDENGIGEIIARGPNIMLGYYEMPELTKEVIVDGWFHTGDLGYFDKEGFLHITGRNKDMIVLKNGKKVFPEELEALINRIDLISECMVFGLEDENDKNDITISIKIVYDEDVIKEKYSDKTEEELRKIAWEKIKEVNSGFPKYKHIQKLMTSHTELIKTSTKKIKRFEEIKIIKEELAKSEDK